MNALISPNEISPYIVGWTYNAVTRRWEPVEADVPDSWRVAQVQETTFEVADPMFWTACADDVVADAWYYQTTTGEILPIPAPAPVPTEVPAAADQPVVSGAQSL